MAVNRYRDSRLVHCVPWIAIALGIVPAIAAQNILPLDSFVLHFGIDIEQITYLPPSACLLLALAGALAAVVQRRLWCLPLLLPLAALSWFDIGQLTFKLPTYSDAQEELRENTYRALELESPPTVAGIGAMLEQVRLTDDDLIVVDREKVREDLDKITQTKANTDTGDRIRALKRKIASLTSKIRRADDQLRRTDKALRDTAVISRLTLGITDKHLRNKLLAARDAVSRQRNALISQRSAARAALAQQGAADRQLHDLWAKVETYVWASNALESRRLARTYALACFVVLLVIVGHFSLGSWIYLFTLGASVLVTLLHVEAPPVFRLWTLASFLLVSLALRVLYLVLVNNYPLLRRQPGKFLGRVATLTLAYYLPFIALISASLGLSWWIGNKFEKQVYDNVRWIENSDKRSDTFRRDIDVGIDGLFEKLEVDAKKAFKKISTGGRDGVSNVRKGVIEAYEEAFPADLGPEFRVEVCDTLQWVLDPPTCSRKEVKNALNAGYRKVRAERLAALKEATKDYEKLAGKSGAKAAAIALEDLRANLLEIRLGLKTQLNRIYSALDFYLALARILLGLMILKSLSYLFARVFFAAEPADDSRLIQFEDDPRPAQAGAVREVAERIELRPDLGARFFVSKKFEFANAPPDEATPQAGKALLSRFVNGTWHMNRIEIEGRDPAFAMPYRLVPGDERIVAWTLKPGDAVIFSWRNFVAMNEAVRIRMQYSWQLSSLVFGRMFYVVASVDADSASDGCLLLHARGSHGIDPADSPSSSPEQLLAWQTTTRFRMHARLTLRNIYRSGIQIRALDSDLAVMHLAGRKRRSGAAAFLRYFLVPV